MIKTILDEQLLKNTGQVILSFDDGPNPHQSVTKNLLQVLNKHAVYAAFSLIGSHVKHAPELVQAYADAGHILVNHGYDHRFNHLLNERVFWQEIETCDAIIATALHKPTFKTSYYRPPYGILKPKQYNAIQNKKKLTKISFFINEAHASPKTFKQKLQKIADKLIANQGGAIVLHERRYSFWEGNPEPIDSPCNKSWVPEGVDWLINTLKAQDLVFTNYDKLA